MKSPETAARRLQDVCHQTTLHDSTNGSRAFSASVMLVCINYANATWEPISIRAAADDAVSKSRSQHLDQSGSRQGLRGPQLFHEGEQDAKSEAMMGRHLEKLSPEQAEINVEASKPHQKGRKFEEILMKSQKTDQNQKIKGLTKANA